MIQALGESPFATIAARIDPMREAMCQITTLPRKGTPAAELTDQERLALCIAAGAPTELSTAGGFLAVRTTVLCGVADRGDGGYVVAVGPATRAAGQKESP